MTEFDAEKWWDQVWLSDGGKVCKHCGVKIHHDDPSGYWMHNPINFTPGADKYADGHNGFYCTAEMWNEGAERTCASPILAGVEAAQHEAFLVGTSYIRVTHEGSARYRFEHVPAGAIQEKTA